MRTKLFCLLLATLLLSGCTGPGTTPQIPASTPAVTPTPSPAPAIPAQTAAPTAEPTPEPTPEPALQLSAEAYPWDEMQPVGIWGTTPMRTEPGYYTVSKDGLWGLITADGQQLLDCVSERPLDLCDMEEWICDALNTYTTEEHPDAAALRQATGKSLCLGHGVSSRRYYYDLDRQQARGFSVLDGSTLNQSVSEIERQIFGDWLPVYPARMQDEYDLGPAEGGWGYINAAGEQLHPQNADGAEPDAAGWFFGEALAPVGFDGKWAYINRSGNLVTEAVYEPIWHKWGEENPPTYAASLQNGYAAVCREGKWGLLDSTGAEALPCEYAGTAWEGTVLWVKTEDGWHKAEIPVGE